MAASGADTTSNRTPAAAAVRALVVEDSSADAEVFAKMATNCGIHARVVPASSVLDALAKPGPDLVVTFTAPSEDARLIEQARAFPSKPYLYVVRCSAVRKLGDVGEIFSVGADDLWRRTRGGFDAQDRLRALARMLRHSTHALSMTPPPPAALTAFTRFVQAPATLDAIRERVRDALCDPLQSTPTVSPTPKLPCAEFVAHLTMVDPSHLIDVMVTLCVSGATARRLTQLTFGGDKSPTLDLVGDLFGEATNLLAGRLKELFLRSGFHFVLGLAEVVSPARWSDLQRAYRVLDAVEAKSDAGGIAVVTSFRPTRRVAIQPAQLTEGMVVIEDLHSVEGSLILKAGTRLTSSTASRLGQFRLPGNVAICEARLTGRGAS